MFLQLFAWYGAILISTVAQDLSDMRLYNIVQQFLSFGAIVRWDATQ